MLSDTFPKRSQIKFIALLAGILLLAAGLRGYQLDRALGGNDENAMLLYFGYTHPKYIATTYSDPNNHIFHTLLVNLMTRWFGEDNALAVRMPTFLFGVAGLWMVYLIGLQITSSRWTATLSLLLASLNPVHIHYSQTARGYSLIMFFSAAIIYLSINLLHKKPGLREMGALVICGFLSIYTLPTNVFFLIGLAGWLGAVLIIPSWAEEFGFAPGERNKKALWIAGITASIALLTFIAYAPLKDQILNTVKSIHLDRIDAESMGIWNLLPGIIEQMFPGPLVWFLPFLLIGCIRGLVTKKNYRWLPVVILFLPWGIASLTDFGGFPRNHLFNLPLLIIFLSSGIGFTANYLNCFFLSGSTKMFGRIFLPLTYSAVALWVIIFHHYPSLKVPDGNLYRENIRANTSDHDLIMINDPRIYLYARTVQKENLENILLENSLSGINLVLPSKQGIKHFEIKTPNGPLKILQDLLSEGDLKFLDVSGGKKMTSLTHQEGFAVLQDDFESNISWKIVQGEGEISQEPGHKLTGEHSLRISAKPGKDMIIQTVPSILLQLKEPVFMILAWSGMREEEATILYHPAFSARYQSDGKTRIFKLLTGGINEGINIKLREKTASGEQFYWSLNSDIGLLPPGSYSLHFNLKCQAGKTVFYDSLRLFLIKIPTNFLNPQLETPAG